MTPLGSFPPTAFPSRHEVAKVFAERGLKSLYLEAETPLAESRNPLPMVPPDILKWRQEHAKIRAALQDWQAILAGLDLHSGEIMAARQSALGSAAA